MQFSSTWSGLELHAPTRAVMLIRAENDVDVETCEYLPRSSRRSANNAFTVQAKTTTITVAS